MCYRYSYVLILNGEWCHFGQENIYDTPDRRGIAVDLLILFRDIHPKRGQFCKLTELVLKNNIQCKLYSKANFQVRFFLM